MGSTTAGHRTALDRLNLAVRATLPWLALILLAVAVGLATGPIPLGPSDLLAAAFGNGSADAELALALRFPRVLTALLVGGGLAGAGAALQIIFRNPLVAPDLLGVSSGAGLGAAAALLAGAGTALVQLGAFAGGLVAAAIALGSAAMVRSGSPSLSLVLCGIVTSALASAGLAIALVLADPYSELPAITFWLLGSFARAQTAEALLAAAMVLLGLLSLLWLGFRLDVLALGDDQARGVGLAPRPLRLAVVAGATLATSAAVAVAGVVGWIGLIAPHAARQVVGEEANRLLPASIALGSVFALLIDRLSSVAGPAEIPVGLLAALVGAPAFLFLFILLSRREA